MKRVRNLNKKKKNPLKWFKSGKIYKLKFLWHSECIRLTAKRCFVLIIPLRTVVMEVLPVKGVPENFN